MDILPLLESATLRLLREAGHLVRRPADLHGFVDHLSAHRIAGWAAWKDQSRGFAAVEILINGRCVARLEASLERPDLRAVAPKCRAAFEFNPYPYLIEGENQVVVRFADTHAELVHGSQTVWRGRPPVAGEAKAGPAPAGGNPWNEDRPADFSHSWMGAKACLDYINRQITGDPAVHWIEHLLRTRLAPAVGKVPGAKPREAYRCLILGSNEGRVERYLCEGGFVGPIVASDIADRALARAAEQARAAGYANIRHIQADLNTADLASPQFGGPFDFVLAEGVLHHIGGTERCLRMLHESLTPDGFLAMVEYEGPVRFQMTERQTRWINAALATMPRWLRPLSPNEDRDLPITAEEQARLYFVPPPENLVEAADPTEAIAGAALKTLVPQVFEIVERRGYGGTLLAYIPDHFDFRRANQDPTAERWLKLLIEIERTLIETGVLEDENFFTVARRKR